MGQEWEDTGQKKRNTFVFWLLLERRQGQVNFLPPSYIASRGKEIQIALKYLGNAQFW